MSKYIDADLLRKEIEKHIKEVKDAAERFTPNLGFFDAKLSGIYDVMAIIDSLQQEQPSLPDNLDEAANRQAALEQPYKWEEEQDGSFGVTPLFVMSNIRSAFKAGAEWMAEQGYTVSSGEPDAMGDTHTDWLGFSHVLWNWMVKTGFCKIPYNGDLVVQIRKKQLLGEA